MTLATGTRLGPYEILSPLGAGGMGEVYKARDSKLKRDVAVKVLPESLSTDTDALSRFEREAHSVASLNHPNILSIFDFGTHDGTAFAVMELLQGETLRDMVAGGPLPIRKTIDISRQICAGLSAAHAAGIVHRDLKPDNLFVTQDGRVKILDFGLAKPTAGRNDASMETHSPTVSAYTEPGTVMGTVGYMSPEQVKGQSVDYRSDIFSFGAVLYEMLTGRRAFQRDTSAETMTAILREDPPELSPSGARVSPALDRILRHCLEKKPEQRFQSASDIAFALESLSTTPSGEAAGTSSEPARKTRFGRPGLAVGALAALAVAFGIGRATQHPPPPPELQRLTFQRGVVDAARFGPDGQTIVYGAAWGGKPPQIFTTRTDSKESRAIGITQAGILAVSSTGEMALATNRRPAADFYWNAGRGNLARAPLAGGAPHEVTEGVFYADFSPDGRDLAIVRQEGRSVQIEYPAGTVLYTTTGYVESPRVSPDGGRIAFLEFPARGISAGSVAVVDRKGVARTLASGFIRLAGLAWSADGREVWFTGSRIGSAQALYAVTLDGRERLVLRVPGTLVLHDISPDGRVLLAIEDLRRELRAKAPGEAAERDVTWLDFPALSGMTDDGTMIAFSEYGDAGGATHGTYIQRLDGSAPVKIADLTNFDLSPDGQWALGTRGFVASAAQLFVSPTEIGQPRALPTEPIDYQWAWFFPDGKHFVFTGSAPGHGLRSYVQDIAGGRARAITAVGTAVAPADIGVVSADGRFVIVHDPQGHALLWPVEGGTPKQIPGFDDQSDVALRFASDGHTLLVADTRRMPIPLTKIDLTTGHRELWREVAPPDLTGVVGADNWRLTPDLRGYGYNYIRRQSDLYLVRGLR